MHKLSHVLASLPKHPTLNKLMGVGLGMRSVLDELGYSATLVELILLVGTNFDLDWLMKFLCP